MEYENQCVGGRCGDFEDVKDGRMVSKRNVILVGIKKIININFD
jgi:hypothetical protein